MKKLRKGEMRFIAKKFGRVFGVYDRANGSYPYRTVELGEVSQEITEKEAQVEAERLNKKVGIAPVEIEQKKQRRGTATGRTKTVQVKDAPSAAEDDWISEETIPDYGELSEEQKAKYTDGLFENTVY